MRKIVIKIDRKHSALEDAAIVLDQGKQQAVFILLFALLYLFRDLVGANVPDIVFTSLCAVSFILADIGTCLGMYIFTTALTVPHNEIRIVYLVIIFAKMFLSGSIQVNGRLLLMNLGLMLLQLLNITIFSHGVVENVVYDYVTKMLVIVLPMIWYNDEYKAEDFRSALMCYVVGVLLGGTITMILTAERVSWEALLKGTGGTRLGRTLKTEEGMQTTYNANQLAIMFAIASAIIVQHIDNKQLSKVLGVTLLGYALFLTVLTRSRTGLLLLAFVVIVYYLVLIVRRKRILGGFLLLGVVALLAFVVIRFFPGVVDAALGRFEDQEDLSNGRVDLFVFYIQKWVETPWCFLFGYGIGSFFDELGTRASPHNSITDILISWGLVGLLLVYGIVFMCYNRGRKGVSKQSRIMAILPAMVAFISSMAGQYLTTGYPHMRLCFLFLAAKAFELEDKNPIREQKTLKAK